MFDFRMTLRENFASFRDEATGQLVFVDSFDNHEFSVRKGTLVESRYIGVVTANTDEALNRKLRDLVESAT
jgi:hypothetical protein